MDLGWALAGGGWCIEGGYSNYSVCMFSSPPLSCYINIQSFGQRLKVHSGNIDRPAETQTKKKAMLNVGFFYDSHRVYSHLRGES